MNGLVDPATLRRRAGELRRLAAALERSSLHELARFAGSDTWTGPLADRFLAEVGSLRAGLSEIADELRRHAATLDATAATAAATTEFLY